MPKLLIYAVIIFMTSGCSTNRIILSYPKITRIRLDIVHHKPPLFNQIGKEVGAWAEWNTEKGICRIHLPWPDSIPLKDYFIYKGHELTHCDFGNWHHGVPYKNRGRRNRE